MQSPLGGGLMFAAFSEEAVGPSKYAAAIASRRPWQVCDQACDKSWAEKSEVRQKLVGHLLKICRKYFESREWTIYKVA